MIDNLKDYRVYRRYSEDGIEVEINRILHKYGIKREAYHGGNISGVRVRRIMADYEDIIYEIFILLKGFSRDYVTDENVEQACRTHAKKSRQLDGAFSCLQEVEPILESIIGAGYFVAASMNTR